MTLSRGRFVLLFGWVLALTGLHMAADDLVQSTWTVDGVTREALVRIPAGAEQGGAPVVFVYHGHGGSMKQAASSMPIHRHWPEAIVVFPQGLPTLGKLTDRAGRQSGWQATAGAQGDRDLKLFDAIFADLLGQYRFADYTPYPSTKGAETAPCSTRAVTAIPPPPRR